MKKTVKTVQVVWEEESRIMVRRHQTVSSYGYGHTESSAPPDTNSIEDIETPSFRTEGENNEK